MFLLFPPQIDIHKGSFDPQMIGKKTTKSPGSYTSYLTASLLSVPWRSLFVVVPMIAFARIFTFGIEHSFLLSEPYQHYNINEQRQTFLKTLNHQFLNECRWFSIIINSYMFDDIAFVVCSVKLHGHLSLFLNK